MGSAVRDVGKEHIPKYPRGWITIRILQFIIAIITLGLCSYLVAVSNTNIIGAGFYVEIFTAVCTIITSIWLISAHSCAPRAFNYWAVLTLDIYQYLLWLGAFAACAILAASLFTGRNLNNTGDYNFKYLVRRNYYDWNDDIYNGGRFDTATAAIGAAAAGLGALEFLLYFICLIVDAVVIHRHRRAGLHSRPVRHVGNILMMPQQQTSAYAAVPQQGVPFTQQETAYNPQQHMYSAPPPPAQQQAGYVGQGYYGSPAPLVPQHTGASYQKTASPAPTHPGVAYPPPPQQQQQQHNMHY